MPISEGGSAELRIGIAATDGTRRPDTPPTVWIALTDSTVPTDERRKWAEDAAKIIGGHAERRWVRRSFAAADLLGGKAFPEQVNALAEVARDLLAAGAGHSPRP